MLSITRRLLLAPSLASLIGCSDAVPTLPASPSPSPWTSVVSGTVYEEVDGSSRPVANRNVDIYVNGPTCVSGQPSPCLSERADVVVTDQNGRYTAVVTVLPKTRVFVTGAGLHAPDQQPCLASELVENDTIIDAQIVPTEHSVTPPPDAGPMITGFVYETTPQGRNPLRRVWAWLEVGLADSFPIARIQTDDAGRFFFCRVNAPVRMVVSGYQDMVASGYRGGTQFIPGTSDMFFEIELKR